MIKDNSIFDYVVVGGGPSGMFFAYEMIEKHPEKRVLIIERGMSLKKRACPKKKTGVCANCKPFCHITNGSSGAGAFSDGKLSLYNPKDDDFYVGGNLHKYAGVDRTKKLVDYTDSIYLKFGATTELKGTGNQSEVTRIRKKAESVGVDSVSIPIRHLGTEKSHEIYARIEKYLEEHGINMMFNTIVDDIIVENGKVKGVKIKAADKAYEEDAELENIYGEKVVIAVGRKGANWLTDLCEKHKINTRPGTVDIGVRYELPDSIMTDVNKYMYEGKFIGRPEPFRDKVRTFCQNPSGFVANEVYDNNLTLVNGHSYKDKKSTNTNLAILVSHNFTYPFNKPIDYGRNVAKNLNELGAGNIVVQRLGDIYRGKRTWENELNENSVVPTLKTAVPGDITFALGYRTMTNILRFIRGLDKVIEGFANPDNLLYGPEIKFYSNKVEIDNNFETNIRGLYCIGDGGGMTRGLMMASCSGIELARILEG